MQPRIDYRKYSQEPLRSKFTADSRGSPPKRTAVPKLFFRAAASNIPAS
jgi:hypothetical protein